MSVQILVGDCRAILPTLPADYYHTVCTSPPYWGLRDYGIEPVVWEHPDTVAYRRATGDWESVLCEHVWGDAAIMACGNAPSEKSTLTTNNGQGPLPGDKYHHDNSRSASTGQFCQLCGAWLGCLGLEPTPDLYVTHLVEIFREARRVLRPDGTLCLNLGDCYYSNPGNGRGGGSTLDGGKPHLTGTNRTMQESSLKPKDLVGIPWMVAFALRADGWWLRSDVIWHKPNGMPESVRDRPTSAHEHVFLLAKSERYFYDQDAIREPMSETSHGGNGANPGAKQLMLGRALEGSTLGQTADQLGLSGRNKRNVWTIPTHPYPDSHFATYPPALVELCLKAGTSAYGCCPDCGAPWERVTAQIDTGLTQKMADGWDTGSGGHGTIHRNGREKGKTGKPVMANVTTGFRPTCGCYDERYRQEFPRARSHRKRQHQDMADNWFPRVRRHAGRGAWPTKTCRVLDPFGGAGTTGLVADRLGLDATLIEIKDEYAEMARARIAEDAPPMFADIDLDALSPEELLEIADEEIEKLDQLGLMFEVGDDG